MSVLESEIVETGDNPTASVIWLHGLGADGNDFVPVIPALSLNCPTRFIFPHAPMIPVTINAGYVMRAWYDILNMAVEREINHKQFNQSVEAVNSLINQEIERGIPANRIVLIGFSQGGAIAYQAGLTFPETLGGIAGLSTYLATRHTLQPSPQNLSTPLKVCHGTRDGVVPESLGKLAVETFQNLDLNPEYSNYPMEHEVCIEEIRSIGQWLNTIF